MLLKKLLIFILFILCSFGYGSAQEMRCLTPENTNPQVFENWLLDMKSAQSVQRLAMSSYNVPVIVHIIHDGEATGTGSNISLEQVISQFVVLNDDFRRTNDDAIDTPEEFLHVAGNMNITFVPAVEDESGTPLSEPGINRIDRNTKSFTSPPYASPYIEATIKPATIWDPDKYFNIWVMDFQEALGYAQPPASIDPGADPDTDGIVVRHSAFGTTGTAEAPWDGGRVTTHETGHWLGLYHIWGQSPDNACGEDDFVMDTPNQDEPSQFCPTSSGTTCSGVTREMWENYMDYTWDECMNLFTIGQVDRMTVVIENDVRREPLLSSAVGGKFDQEITFGPQAEVQFGDSDIELSATSDSGLPITYTSSDETVATVVGSTVSILGAGSTVITAQQEGDYLFHAGDPVLQTLIVIKADQTISLDAIPELTYGDNPVMILGSATSGLDLEFGTLDPTVVDITGSILTVLSGGTATITADQIGDDNYNAAPQVQQVIEIKKLDQTVTMESVATKTYNDPDFVLRASSSSGLNVNNFLSGDDTILSISDSIATIKGTGEVKLIAIQEGNMNYDQDSDTITVNVQKAHPNWIISGANDHQDSLSTIPLIIDTDADLPLNYTVDPPILVFNSSWEVLGYGKAQITANQLGDDFYHPTDTIVSICILPSPVIYEDTLENEDYDQILWTDYGGVNWILPNITIVQSDTITVDTKGVYSVEIQTEGCPTVTTNYEIDEIVSIMEVMNGLGLRLFPNPAGENLFVQFTGEPSQNRYYYIIDLSGKHIMEQKPLAYPLQKVDINHLKSGVYFIRILTEEKAFSLRFVKE